MSIENPSSPNSTPPNIKPPPTPPQLPQNIDEAIKRVKEKSRETTTWDSLKSGRPHLPPPSPDNSND